jgi:hypothetical protein
METARFLITHGHQFNFVEFTTDISESIPETIDDFLLRISNLH